MSTPPSSTSHQDQAWPEELATFLGPRCFPATHDHLVATLIKRHAPSRLVWHVSSLPRTRHFQSLGEVIEHLTQDSSPSRGSVSDVF